MALVETLSIQMPEAAAPGLLGSYIERPAAGTQADVYMLHVSGWVLGSGSPAVGVEALHEDRLLRTAPVRGPRADLESGFDIPPGTDAEFHALIGVIGLPPEFQVDLRAVLEDGGRAAIGSVRARHEPLPGHQQAEMRPVLVTAMPGTGAGWLVELLAGHPQIVVDARRGRVSPGRYWLRMLKVLSEPANLVESSDPVSFPGQRVLGHNPFYDDDVARRERLGEWFGRTHVEHLARFCTSLLDEWYSTARREQAKPTAGLFAEAHFPDHVPWLMRELYPQAREVFLLAERTHGDSVAFRRALNARGPSSLQVRYEELVADPLRVVARILGYLDLDSKAETVEALLQTAEAGTPG